MHGLENQLEKVQSSISWDLPSEKSLPDIIAPKLMQFQVTQAPRNEEQGTNIKTESKVPQKTFIQ